MTGIMEFLLPGEKLEGMKVLEENAGTIALAGNPIISSNSKHSDVRNHSLRELVEKIGRKRVQCAAQRAKS